jgi:membrane-associated phospholipid phosphatase
MGRPVPPASGGVTERTDVTAPLTIPSEKVGILQRLNEFDKQLSLRVYGGGMLVPHVILKILEYSGDGTWIIPGTAALWLAPVLRGQDELRGLVFNFFVALIFDLVFVGVVKGIIRRPRPVYNKGMYLVLSVDEYSFPSGHTSRALMIAMFYWLNLPVWKTILAARLVLWEQMLQNGGPQIQENVPYLEICLAIALWIWALSTAASRVLLGRHYVFDIMVGSLVGILEAVFVHLVLYVPKNVSDELHDNLLRVFNQTFGLKN